MRILSFLRRKAPPPPRHDLDSLKNQLDLLTEKMAAMHKAVERIDDLGSLTLAAQVELRRDLDEVKSAQGEFASILNDPEVVEITNSIGRIAA